MDVTALADPRTFADGARAPAGDAALYEAANSALAAATAREQQAFADQLRDALVARLRDGGAALAALFAAAPSVDVARALWRALDDAWREAIARDADVAVTIFALPVVVIAAGSAGAEAALSGTLDDAGSLAALLREHGALRGNRTLALADVLVSPEALDVDRLPAMLSWHRLDAHAAALRTLAAAPIRHAPGREGVHARLIVGSALAAPGVDLLERAPKQGWAMPFTRELVRRLAVADATVLALPAPPAYPLQAVRSVRAAQRDVAAQLFVSNALRAIRSRSGEPVAILSAHRAADAPGRGELRLSLSSPFEPRDAEGFRCPLYPLDRAADTARMLVALLADCRVTDIRIVAGVHADRIGETTQPLLFKPDTLPADTSTLH